MTSERESFHLQAALVMAESANQAMRAANEHLKLAEQARLTAERESPFAGSRDPGALPGVLGSRSTLRSVS